MAVITSKANWRPGSDRRFGNSVILRLLVVLACALPSFPGDWGLLADGNLGSSNFTPARKNLGVWLENTMVFFSGFGWIEAVRITAVDPGSPAQAAGLGSGDIVIWAGGRHVRRFEELQEQVAQTSTALSLAVVKADTHYYITLPPIVLEPLNAGAPSSPAQIRPAPYQVPYSYGKVAPAPHHGSVAEPRKNGRGPAAGTAKGHPPADSSDDNPGEGDVAESASILRRFPWPPPKASSWTKLKPEVFHRSGQRESLRDVARRIEAAFRSAGYIEWSYYAVPKGFAVVSQLEQYLPDGTPLKEPDRWSAKVSAPRVFSLESYLKALFTANPGQFRIVVLILTSEPVTHSIRRRRGLHRSHLRI